MNAEGYPISWRHFCLGVRAHVTELARQQLRLYGPLAAVHGASDQARQEWIQQTRYNAGLDY